MPRDDKGLPLGNVAPEFALATAAGEVVRLSEYRGRWVIVLFGRGTW